MSSLKVPLPEKLQKYVKARAAQSRHKTAAEYVRSLILEDQRRHKIVGLEALLIEGLNSGAPIRMDKADWQNIRATARKSLSRKKAS